MSDLRDGSGLRDDEQRAVEAMQRASAEIAQASPFATARAARALDAAIDGEGRARARWTTTRVAAVALVAAASAGALAFQLARTPSESHASSAPAATEALAHVDAAKPVETAPASFNAVPATSSAPPLAPTVVVPDALAVVTPEENDVGRVEPAKRIRRTPVAESERLAAAGDAVAAARVLLRAPDAAGAAAPLALLARAHPEAISAVDDELAQLRSTDAMRVRCQHRLLHERDQRAMDACRAFGREHPQDAAARLLSFAAGRLAEDRGDLAWAEEEYSRALLLSPFAGLSGTDALLARARVRFSAGDTDEARADLRLYLHSEPSARREADVAKLATALGL